MDRVRNGPRRVLSIIGGIVLVGAFLMWMAIRNHDAMRFFVGMDSAIGWIAQIVAFLVLTGGVALLARGIFGRRSDGAENAEADALSDQPPR